MVTRTSETLAVTLFGKPNFRYGDAPLRLAVAKTTLTVLAYLLLNRSALQRRDDVAFTIWPDDTESEARANLRRHVYLLSRALPQSAPQWIVSDTRLVGWNAEAPLELDVDAFERFAADPQMRARALEVYAGDLMPNVEAEWLEGRRRHYRELFCDAALASARSALEAGAYQEAAGLAQRVIELDAWHEEALRTLVDSRQRAGDRAGALVAYQDFKRRLHDELGAEPMPETQSLYDTVVKGAAVPVPRHAHPPRNSLPVNLARFIGREREVADVATALATCRLVTLTGAGGVGKSRLAIRVAESIHDRFEDEPIFVELATIANEKRAFDARVLDAFGIAATNEDIVDTLSRVLGSRKCLVILDNVEHVINVTGRFLVRFLARASGVTVIATSRQPVRLQGEQIIALKPLQLPDAGAPLEESMQCEATLLFLNRATSLNSNATFSAADSRDIVAVCRRLDGIPLAIELAAARSNVLTPKEIDARLSDRFELLKSRNFDSLLHHQTLRATLDWSYDLLDEVDRRAFCRLGAFRNGWTLEAAAEVVGLPGTEDLDALESLSRLIDQSLVTVSDFKGSRRYDFLETVRSYALLRLTESNELPLARAATGKYFTRYVDAQQALFASRHEKPAFDRIAIEHDNILSVLDDAIERGDVDAAARLCCRLAPFWVIRGFAVQAQRRVEAVLNADAALEGVVRRELRNVASILHYRRGEIAEAMQRASESNALCLPSEVDVVAAEALMAQARCWYANDDFARARHGIEAALAIFRKNDTQLGIARCLDFLGLVSDVEADVNEATALYQQSLAIYEERGDLQSVATVNYHLGFQAYERGDYAKSIAFSTKAIEVWHEYGNLQGENWAQYNIACAEAALGLVEGATFRHLSCIVTAHRHGFVRDVSDGFERLAGLVIEYAPAFAARCMGYASHLRKQYGHAVLANERGRYGNDVARAEALLGNADFGKAWESGVASDQETLIENVAAAIRRHYST